MTKIPPTVGRVVWYYRDRASTPLAATIAYVYDGGSLINIGYLDEKGAHNSATSVRLLQEGEEAPGEPHCRWMPYQVGQAAKTEQAEAVAEAARKGFKSA